jgi:hypothetical protein
LIGLEGTAQQAGEAIEQKNFVAGFKDKLKTFYRNQHHV